MQVAVIKSKIAIFMIKVKLKVTRSFTLGLKLYMFQLLIKLHVS